MKKLLLLVGLCFCHAAFAANDPMSEEAIAKRTAPVGQVNISGAQLVQTSAAAPVAKKAEAGPRSGKTIYQKHCHVCHANGLAGAPKFRNAAAWKTHIAGGIDHMVINATNGINAMPPKGTCTDCSEKEIKAAIEYMLPKG